MSFFPNGVTIDQFFATVHDPDAFPNLDVAAFDKLHETHSDDEIRWLNEWIKPQVTIDHILRHHGQKGLATVLQGIALASSVHKVHMCDRIASIAGFYGYEVY